MKEAIYYMYREILLSVWDAIIKRDRYKKYYQNIPTLEQDINNLEPKFKQILQVDFDIKFCEDLYNEVYFHSFLGDFMDYAKSDLDSSGIETGERKHSWDYSSRRLAIPITGLDNYYLGFLGGGECDNGWEIEKNCYLLTARDEVKTTKVFEKKMLIQSIINRKVRPIHPGEMITDIFLDRGLTPEIYANGNFILQEILEGKRPISLSFAEELGKQFNVSTKLLMGMQRKVDIWDSRYE